MNCTTWFQKPKGLGGGGGKTAPLWHDRTKTSAITKAQFLGGTDMKRCWDIDCRVFAKDYSRRIDEKEISVADFRFNGTVNRRRGAAGNATDDILEGIGTGEGGDVVLIQAECAEAVKEIVPRRGSQALRDGVLGASERHSRTGVGGSVGGDGSRLRDDGECEAKSGQVI